jgi:replication factor C large subunit
MSDDSQPWNFIFKPRNTDEIVGNRFAIDGFSKWLRSWKKKAPKKKSAFLYGPPGTGKSTAVHVIAKELGFEVLEVNASDYRTKKRIEELIGRAIKQPFTLFGKRRMILFDEMEGISGRADRGGVSTIVNVIGETLIPVVLVATTVFEDMEEKFRKLRDVSLLIEFRPVSFGEIYERLQLISETTGIEVEGEVLEALAANARGDLRSAINDLESIARGETEVRMEDMNLLMDRDRREYIPEVLRRIFSSKTLWEARKAISTAHIKYDDLYDWIYENLPLVLDDSGDLLQGLEALARADIHQNRARSSQSYRLLKYMFNEMTGGVAISRNNSQGTSLQKQVGITVARLGYPPNSFRISETPNGIMIRPVKYLGNQWRKVNNAFRNIGARWVRGGGGWEIPYFREPQTRWRYIRTYHSRRRLKSIALKIADKCHVSSKEAILDVIPLMQIMINDSQEMSEGISKWLNLEEKEIEHLKKT